ncbi:glycoside hydrolase family 28 protein [Glonium stellatum]|uniref:galacturonan 1,4-alpha-galacturonidase n=1 Tax=Glonium stellatum TaxID=574774 RepID=A0A8E2JMF8_9PEZI|nr:glycoside hydrolase family 28 protein [Glonium stellatum]
MLFSSFLHLLALLLFSELALAAVNKTGSTCIVTPLSATGSISTVDAQTQDDTPQILDAFKQCGKDGSIEFADGTFYIGQVMDTTSLQNCDISIYGKFVWSTDIKYWLGHSISVTYAGRSTAWLFGGTNITMRGYGKALFDGNGQLWYDQNRNQGNQNGRPISLTVWHAQNVLIDGITWRQSQFWHTFVAHSQNVTMTNLDMNATSNSQYSTVNTDGTDTWNSRDVFMSNWTVTCGDDCMSVKGNSTNIHISNIVCHESGGMVVGSIGSNSGQPDNVENVLFENVSLTHSSNAAWIKTYPGTGYVRNVTFRNIHFTDVNQPIYITPCIYSASSCDNSRLQISNVRWENITGTSRYNVGAGMHCSSAAPCQNLTFSGIDITQKNGGSAVEYLCSNIANQKASGLACTGSCPANWPQQLSGNH